MSYEIERPTKADVDTLNAIDPPTRGTHRGSGRHVTIPDDWADRIARGEDVPGCTYHRLPVDREGEIDEATGETIGPPVLTVSDRAAALLDDPGQRAKVGAVEAERVKAKMRARAQALGRK
jgi:hypothetical protein